MRYKYNDLAYTIYPKYELTSESLMGKWVVEFKDLGKPSDKFQRLKFFKEDFLPYHPAYFEVELAAKRILDSLSEEDWKGIEDAPPYANFKRNYSKPIAMQLQEHTKWLKECGWYEEYCEYKKGTIS